MAKQLATPVLPLSKAFPGAGLSMKASGGEIFGPIGFRSFFKSLGRASDLGLRGFLGF